MNKKQHIIDVPDVPKIGVYAIRNKKNNKYYVGSSSNIKARMKTHRSNLERLYGSNTKMDEDLKSKDDIIYFAEAYAEDIKSGGANINALEYSYMWTYASKNNNPIAFTENEDRECTAKIPNFDGLDDEVINIRREILAKRGIEYREMKEYKDFL